MNFKDLNIKDLKKLEIAFIECFKDDKYYKKLDINIKSFYNLFLQLINRKLIKGIFIGDKLVSFIIYFNWNLVKQNNNFKQLCFGNLQKQKQYFKFLDNNCENNTIYLLSIGVLPQYRGYKYASFMLDNLINEYKNYKIISDVSNKDSLIMYRNRNFQISEIDKNYFLVKK